MSEYSRYCPLCARFIEPENIDEYESGEHDGLLYVHDADVTHTDEDLKALEVGVQ